jgi:hypothetical protein
MDAQAIANRLKEQRMKSDKPFIDELKRCIAYLEQGRGREIRESQERLRVIIEERQKAYNEALKEMK